MRIRPARPAWRRQRGSAAVEAVIVMPAFMVVVLVAIQFALWSHASHLAQEAASRGEEAARIFGSAPQSGQAAAQAFLSQTAGSLLTATAVSESDVDTEVSVNVSGDAETILPFFRWPVSATSSGPLQGFRVTG